MSRRRRPLQIDRLAPLQGERLVLRAPQRSDAAAIYAYAGDPAVTRYLAWPRHTGPADSECFVEIAIEGWRSATYPVWMIEDGDGVAGAIGARLSGANAGIGYVLARNRWGQGYATEALRQVSEALFLSSPVTSLWAMCVNQNGASQRVLEKSGFGYLRTMTNYFSCPNLGGETRDVMLYVKEKGG